MPILGPPIVGNPELLFDNSISTKSGIQILPPDARRAKGGRRGDYRPRAPPFSSPGVSAPGRQHRLTTLYQQAAIPSLPARAIP